MSQYYYNLSFVFSHTTFHMEGNYVETLLFQVNQFTVYFLLE